MTNSRPPDPRVKKTWVNDAGELFVPDGIRWLPAGSGAVFGSEGRQEVVDELLVCVYAWDDIAPEGNRGSVLLQARHREPRDR